MIAFWRDGGISTNDCIKSSHLNHIQLYGLCILRFVYNKSLPSGYKPLKSLILKYLSVLEHITNKVNRKMNKFICSFKTLDTYNTLCCICNDRYSVDNFCGKR